MSDGRDETNMEGDDRHCKRCNRADSYDDMVCCEQCESWIHFQCAGVSPSIAEPDRSFKCSNCVGDCGGASKSVLSFNESSVSKSSRVSMKLQLSLQLLEDQRNLQKKRTEEEAKLKAKAMDEEQEYLKQRYELLMQIEDERDPSSRKSGVSVKKQCERMESWLNKGAAVDGTGQSRPKAAQQAPPPVPTVSEQNRVVGIPVMTASGSGNRNSSNPGVLPSDRSVNSIVKSYESASVTMPEGAAGNLPPFSIVPEIVVATAGGSFITRAMSATKGLSSVASPVLAFSETIPCLQNPPIYTSTVPVHSYPEMTARLTSVAENNRLLPYAPNSSSGYLRSGLVTTASSSIPISMATGPAYVPENHIVPSTIQYNPSGAAPRESPLIPIPEPRGQPSSGIHGDSNGLSVSLGPTSTQLAARQVMPRELPKFNGDPQEWPMFYSSFKNTTEVCGYTDAENLARLQRCLGGAALEAVKSRLLLPASVPYVMETLHKLYGRPEVLISSLLKKVRNVPPPKSDNLNSIVTYGLAVQNLVDHIILADQQAHLTNPMLLQELIDKLPTSLKMQWGTYKQAFANVNLATFNNFMSGLVNLAAELCIDVGSVQYHHQTTKSEKSRQKEKLFTHASASSRAPTEPLAVGENTAKLCSYCDKGSHRIADCFQFKALDIGSRWKAVRQNNLCRSCLIPHRKWPCRSRKECGVDGCRVRHHMLLHSIRDGSVHDARHGETVHQNHHHVKSFSLFRYLPVTLYGDGKQVETFAFLDDGSSSTLLEEGIAALLGIEGELDNLWLSWTGKISRHEKTSKRVTVDISGGGRRETFRLANVRTVRELGLPSQTLNYADLSSAFPHLQGLPVASYVDAKPSMIIGLEHVRLLTSLKTREGDSSEPVAAKTRLGWCVYGRNSGSEDSAGQLHIHTCEEMSNSSLHDSMRKFFAVEEVVLVQQLESEEDKRTRNILEATTVRRGKRIETGLLWRSDEVDFPNSYQMALNRLRGLERRLGKDPELRRRVNEQLKGYEQKQYVSKVSPGDVSNMNPRRVWYLPLGVVTSPKKPDKVRVVWDAAAKVSGISFNDMLLKGPDLLVPLVNVLLRFREGKIAVCSDIREMFMRILIREEDKWSQCFVWRYSPADEVQIYVINVAMFGATSSPCTAQFVKNKNALEYAEAYPRATNAIIYNHYVDDFLDSVNSVTEAVTLVKEVQFIHAAAGFEFGKILSNSQEVLHQVGETVPAANKSLFLDKEQTYERVLGIVWVPSTDHFTFDQTGIKEVMGSSGNIPTKRQVLRIVMKLYDPLGFVAHFVVQGKILMQEIWRSGTNWDEPIPEQLFDSWSRWIELYESIGDVKIPRCFFGDILSSEVCDIEIHVFTDASVTAYACVAYLRMSYCGRSCCSLIAAKTKVAPLRALSISRLELQAAMMGSRLLHSVCCVCDSLTAFVRT